MGLEPHLLFMQGILDARGSLDSFRHIALGAVDGMAADLRAVLSRPDRPDAVLCGGDNMALALIDVAGELGLRIPEDVSLVGGSGVFFHDPRLASMTRVQQPVREIGRELFLLVENLVNHPGRNQPGKYLPCGLLGGSTTTPGEGELLRKMLARDRRTVSDGSRSAGSEAALS
jgi:DNA-binding LacI/PurR family transcriptional regulator